jgi:hypothetical protein
MFIPGRRFAASLIAAAHPDEGVSMKTKALTIVAAGALAIAASGCGLIPSSNAYWQYRMDKLLTQDTDSVQSAADRMHVQRQVANQDARALVDDLDMIFMTERPSRLSRSHNR